MRSGQGKTHRCRLCGAGVTKQKSSTTGLLKHFNTGQLPGHREVWRMAMNESKHSKTTFNDEGDVAHQAWSFDEMLEPHIWWTRESTLHDRPQAMMKDKGFRGFLETLQNRYSLPHIDTMDKIAQLDEEMVMIGIKEALQKVKKEIGSPFLSIQFDMWSTPNAHEAHGSLNGSVIEDTAIDDDDMQLVLSQFLLAFDVFPDIEHTGDYILH